MRNVTGTAPSMAGPPASAPGGAPGPAGLFGCAVEHPTVAAAAACPVVRRNARRVGPTPRRRWFVQRPAGEFARQGRVPVTRQPGRRVGLVDSPTYQLRLTSLTAHDRRPGQQDALRDATGPTEGGSEQRPAAS